MSTLLLVAYAVGICFPDFCCLSLLNTRRAQLNSYFCCALLSGAVEGSSKTKNIYNFKTKSKPYFYQFMFLKNLLVPSLFAKTNKNLEQHDGISSVL